MALYFFHVRGCMAQAEAGQGLEFPDADAARAAAVSGARSLIAADVINGTLDLTCRMDVADEQGQILFSVPFNSVVSAPDRGLGDRLVDQM